MIKAQIITANDVKNLQGNSFKFPDKNDIKLIKDNFNGLKAQMLISSKVLNKALNETSEKHDLNVF